MFIFFVQIIKLIEFNIHLYCIKINDYCELYNSLYIEAAVQHVRGCKFGGTCIYRGGNGKAQLVNNNTTH